MESVVQAFVPKRRPPACPKELPVRKCACVVCMSKRCSMCLGLHAMHS